MVLTFGEGSRWTAARDAGRDVLDVSVEETVDVELVVKILLLSLLAVMVVVLVLFIVVVTAAGEVIVMECGSSAVGLSWFEDGFGGVLGGFPGAACRVFVSRWDLFLLSYTIKR